MGAAESSYELIIADTVRKWVGSVAPGVPRLADQAAVVAVRAYEAGASVAEACEEARRYTESRLQHPAGSETASSAA